MSRMRQRLAAWFESRLPRTDVWTLTQRNVYIVPTRAGFMFALVLLVMLLATINYQLSLGYVLTFLLAGAGLVSMHMTHNTLRGMTLHFADGRSSVRSMGFVRPGQPVMVDLPHNCAPITAVELDYGDPALRRHDRTPAR